MAIYNLGSINIDMVYRVPRLPAPGETLAAYEHLKGLGGKGANMSVAAARAAARVHHIGAVGREGAWAVERLMEYGVDTRSIDTAAAPTGHAIIAVDDHGENSIILYHGANHTITEYQITKALQNASSADSMVLQNETNAQVLAASRANALGMKVIYAAAPFDAQAVADVAQHVDLLVLNEVEAHQLEEATGRPVAQMGIEDVVVTLGADGCRHINVSTGKITQYDAVPVTPVDTTGAGDTFTGYLAAGLDRGMSMAQAIHLATVAGAIMVTRLGTADVIPDLKDIEDFKLG